MGGNLSQCCTVSLNLEERWARGVKMQRVHDTSCWLLTSHNKRSSIKYLGDYSGVMRGPLDVIGCGRGSRESNMGVAGGQLDKARETDSRNVRLWENIIPRNWGWRKKREEKNVKK